MQSVHIASRASGKRPRPKSTKVAHKQARNKSEDEVQAFINGTGARGGPPIKADVQYMRVGKSYIATWEQMEKQGSYPAAADGSWDCPTDGMDRKAFEACGSTLRSRARVR